MRQPTEITFETEETVILREGSSVCIEYCSGCGKDVLMATPRTAALLSNSSERDIFRLLESNLIHFSENGRVLICLASVDSIGKTIEL